jgi:hypothetical protein
MSEAPVTPAAQALDALEFAYGAVLDAIGLEDGLDGAAGHAVLKMVRAALVANGRTPPTYPAEDEVVTPVPFLSAEAPVTPAVSPLWKLVEQWRAIAKEGRNVGIAPMGQHAQMLLYGRVADQLEAALSTPAPRPETEDVRELAAHIQTLIDDQKQLAGSWRRLTSDGLIEALEKLLAGAAPRRAEAPPSQVPSNQSLVRALRRVAQGTRLSSLDAPLIEDAADILERAGAPGSRDGWQPISSAPKDGRLVWLVQNGDALGLSAAHQFAGYYVPDKRYAAGGFWQMQDRNYVAQPTHWRALPAAPGAETP